jgi:hypothetical protein
MKNLCNSLLLCGIVFFWVPAAANAQVAPPRGAGPRRQSATPKLLPAPVDWRFEAMPLPPRFAPKVKWTGFEEIRFAPGVFDNSSPNYFSYVIALSVNGTSAIDAAGIKDFLETYFRGLLPLVGQRKGLTVNASQIAAEIAPAQTKPKTNARYQGTVTIIDTFTDGRKTTLNVEADVLPQEALKKTYVLLLLSPRARDSKIWKTLRGIRDKTIASSAMAAALDGNANTIRWGHQLMSETDDVPRSAVVDNEGGIYFVFKKQVKDAPGFDGSVISTSWHLLKYNQEGEQLWSKQLDPRIKFTDCIAADDHGNIYVFGIASSTHEGEVKGGSDAFFARYDKAGNQEWLFRLGTPKHDVCTGLDFDADGNMYVAGHTQGDFAKPNKGGRDMFIAAYDKHRTLLWRDQLGTAAEDLAGDIRVGNDNEIYVCGDTFGSLARENNGLGDFFVARYDRTGKRIWLRQYGTNAHESGMPMEIGEFGDIYIGCRTTGSFGYRRPRRMDMDSCLARITTTGKMLWVRQFGTGAWDGTWDLARFTDGSGDILIAGCQIPVKGKCQAFSRRYSSEGKLIWIKEFRNFSESGGTCGRVAAIDSDNNVYLSGWTRADLFGINNGTGNMFIVKFDGAKNEQNSR